MSHHHTGDFMKSALIGGILGGVAGLLLAPKAGRALREDLADCCNTFACKTKDFAEGLHEAGAHFCACCGYEEGECESDKECCHRTPLVAGGALGAVIGAVAALLLAPQSGTRLQSTLGDKYDSIREQAESFLSSAEEKGRHTADTLDEWKDTLATLVHRFSQGKGNKRNGSAPFMNDIAEWASLGLNLYQKFNKK